MNLPLPRREFVAAAIAGFAGLLAAAFPVAAQPTNGTDFSAFQVIAQRNIFNPTRVPHAGTSSARARVADAFSFLGAMSYAKGTFAFFDGASPDFRKVLTLNGDIAGFKVTALTLKSVTLSSGTNEMILPVGAQMRRDDDGHWAVSSEPAIYSGSETSSASGSGSRARNNGSKASAMTADNSQAGDLYPTDSGIDTNAPEAALSSGGANDALTRLMQQRAQEEQQLGQGQ